jgi:hypothetical protein
MKMKKAFTSIRPFTDEHNQGKPKFCATCGNIATQEALFNVGGGITLIQGYCDLCAIIVGGFKPTLK